MSIDSAASKILQRGVQLDNSKRYTEALVCYQEGLQLLLDFMTGESDANKKNYLRNKIEGYINRAEQIKKHINDQKDSGKYHEEITIEDNSKGHSYKSLFGRFLNEEITCVDVEDPYIRSFHQFERYETEDIVRRQRRREWYAHVQRIDHIRLPYFVLHNQPHGTRPCGKPPKTVEKHLGIHLTRRPFCIRRISSCCGPGDHISVSCQNLIRLCELLVSCCVNLKSITLMTTQDPKQGEDSQAQWFHLMSLDLAKYNVTFSVDYSSTLHDRKIVLSTGWIIKIGRGLDIYKPTDNKFSLGYHDMDLRACHRTQVDIFHSKHVKKVV